MCRGGGEVERGRACGSSRLRPSVLRPADTAPVARSRATVTRRRSSRARCPEPGGPGDQGAEGRGDRSGRPGRAGRPDRRAVSSSKPVEPSGSSPPAGPEPERVEESPRAARRRSRPCHHAGEEPWTSGVDAVDRRGRPGRCWTTQRSRSTPSPVASWSTSPDPYRVAGQRDVDPRRHPAQVAGAGSSPGHRPATRRGHPGGGRRRRRRTSAASMPGPVAGRPGPAHLDGGTDPDQEPTEVEVEDGRSRRRAAPWRRSRPAACQPRSGSGRRIPSATKAPSPGAR